MHKYKRGYRYKGFDIRLGTEWLHAKKWVVTKPAIAEPFYVADSISKAKALIDEMEDGPCSANERHTNTGG